MAPSAMSGANGAGMAGKRFLKHLKPPILKVSLVLQKDELILYANS